MKFIFSTVYRVTQKDFYACPYTSVWAPVVARQISNDIQALATCLSARELLQAEGPTVWPPRSPDLTPLDFFAWGFVKDVVYRRKVRDLADLRQRITETLELMTPHVLLTRGKSLNIV
jgi:hypothetical protein